jgi:predicted nuclease of restriction endonuclease-like (RecB) superfamily
MAFSIGDALRSQLNWTHYRLLMRVDKESVKKFYFEECIAGNWSTCWVERQTEKELKEELEREKRMIEMEFKLLKSRGNK